ncbi:Ig-like domain-containing protein [Pantoea sp. SOD02]|uniref:Ig-like domain-containing protein n=1 Tax=Pantoea sp. SOD02 TaxID=2970818 RepID=UPI0021583C21|nr:Ig-like domain-containing protein [Pantoea sp. SOD02]UVC27968.1 Ig-like domain-containing protein [Pantoea sp. SOD02]
MDILNYTGTKFTERATSLPTISGQAPAEIGKPGALALISVGGLYIQVPVDPVTGKYSWTATEPLPDGDYSLSVAIRDNAGNLGSPTLRTLRIDTTPPEAPLLIKLYDDVGAEQRGFEPGDKTDDKRPTLTGIAQKGTTVYLLNDKDEKIGSAVADKDTGLWKMELSQDLEEGSNALRLVAEEKFADVIRAGTPSAAFNIIIASDGLPPNTVTITEAQDNAGSAIGTLANGALTDDTTPTLSGTASAGSTVIVYYRLAGSNTWAGSATATVTGESWTWTPGSALPVGNYEFQASIGANSSALFSLEIATAEQIGLRTRIESAYDDFGQDQGPLANGAITDDGTPTLRGRAEANGNVIIRYMLEGGSAASVVVNADSAGNWRWTPAAELATGVWSFDVQAQGRSSWSNAFKLEITGSGENSYAPTISYAFDDFGTSTGERKSGASTDDTTPTLHGKAVANSVVYLQAINGAEVETFSVIADASSQWQWTPPAELAAGDWKFQVSKGAGEGFGDAFELKIGNAGSYSNIIDFETLPENLPSTPAIRTPYKFSENLSIIFDTGLGSPTKSKFISPKYANEPSFGSQSLFLPPGEYLKFMPDQDYPLAHWIKDFSMQIYNPDTSNVLIAITVGSYVLAYNLKPGTNNITLESWKEAGPKGAVYPDLFWQLYISTNSYAGVTKGIIVDNFSWTTNYNSEKALLLANEDGNSHKFAGVEELTDTSVIGHEYQIDTLQLTGKDQQLDLTTLSSKIESIEIFDITGTGDNTLKLDLNALLQHGEKDLFIEDGKTQLLVKGNEGDVVQLKDILPESDISEWQYQDGTVTVAGIEYNVYSHGDDAELLVQQGVKTELV